MTFEEGEHLAQETPVPTAGRIRVRGSRRRTGLYLGRRSQGDAGTSDWRAGIHVSYYTPRGLSNEPVNVMVQLAGETVAEVMAEQGQLTAGQKQDIKAALSARQDAIKPAIQGLGGQVLADYQVAYNGIKVRISAEPDGQAS